MNSRADWQRTAAVHAVRSITPDFPHEARYAEELKAQFGAEELTALYGRFVSGTAPFDGVMRRLVWRALAKRFGDGVIIAPGAQFRHLETASIGNGVFFGEQSILQGRHQGVCTVGERAWIGPQAFLDARDLVVGDAVGIGPGVRILGAEHSGEPRDLPPIATELIAGPVRIGAGAIVGTGAIVMPGVLIGERAIVGAGAVVTTDVEPGSRVAGNPARALAAKDQ